MRDSLRRALVTALVALGLPLTTHGLYLPAKGLVAQVLLRHAWARSQGEGEPVRAWPWADTWPVALLETPEGTHVVLSGTHGEALAFGPGWDPRSAIPGALGNVVVAGHRDTHFAELEGLALGDRLQLETSDRRRLTYRVVETLVTDRLATWPLDAPPSASDGWLTLITCYPFSRLARPGPLRYVVRAERLDEPS